MPVSEQGVSLDRYMLIPRTLIFLTRDEHVLLLKGAPHKRLWANRYNGLGGHIEAGEDVIGAARREIREEAGLNPDQLWLCGVITVDTQQNPGIGIYVLRGECSQGTPSPSREGAAEWMHRSKVSELPLVEDLVILLPRVLASKPGDQPFSAHIAYNDAGREVVTFGS
ncbi:MAG TPA: NUDIX domain-containing protein [Anaerolineales bacterium]